VKIKGFTTTSNQTEVHKKYVETLYVCLPLFLGFGHVLETKHDFQVVFEGHDWCPDHSITSWERILKYMYVLYNVILNY
jgi:hypothetical protein